MLEPLKWLLGLKGLTAIFIILSTWLYNIIIIIIIIIIITSSDDIQPSTLLSNQSPSGLIL